MLLSLLIVFSYFVFTNEKHFNGGTIGWAPIDPYDNSSPVDITITQSYSWTYPTIKCANNVPASTSGWSSANTNVTCVVDCSTDGGYSNAPIDILTDCTSASSSLKMMTSEKSKNVTLSADAHFYIAYRGSSWVALNDPAQSGLDWSIVTYIDLRKRSDGLINTPPVAKVVSPQYATVNKTIQIKIPVSDANAGDDVRCRWSTYTTGYRRRKRSGEEKYENYHKIAHNYKTKYDDDKETIDSRKKRQTYSSGCTSGDNCNTGSCPKTNCLGIKCTIACCDFITTTSTTTTSTTSTTKTTTTTSSSTTSTTTVTTTSSTTDSSTSTETPGTPKSTSTYPIRQAIDECADICYPGSMPNGTTLSDCTITFTGHKAGIWYAVAIQVEDFINETSTTPMSSVPVQFLIYVQPQPSCSNQPIFFPLDRCLEVQVGVSISFNLSVMNLCNSSVAKLADIIVSSEITGMTRGNLTTSSTNSSVSYVRFTWTPQINQIGYQQLCTVAYTTENLQSDTYCITFTVKNSSDTCVTTTTTTTSTTSQSTTTTTVTTTTTSSTTTSETTTTTSVTTTSMTTSSTSTSSTSTTSTSSTSTTSTSSTSTTSTSSTSSTSTTSTTTSTTTSVTTTTSTTTTTTTSTTTTVGARSRRRRRQLKEENTCARAFDSRLTTFELERQTASSKIFKSNTPTKDYLINNTVNHQNSTGHIFSEDSRINLFDSAYSNEVTTITDIEESRVSSAVTVKRMSRATIQQLHDMEKLNENAKPNSKLPNHIDNTDDSQIIGRSPVTVVRIPKLNLSNQNISITSQQNTSSASSSKLSKLNQVKVTKIPRKQTTLSQRARALSADNISTIHIGKPFVVMQPLTNHSKTASIATNIKMHKDNRVTVRKLPRKSNIS
ncbi:unnamed protein product [Rotaria sp. Silwood1]|nr:unnamed protein product [Rotaria sp. Silwood1]